MNPFIAPFANGMAFFPGLSACLAGLLVSLTQKSRLARHASNLLITIGLVLIAASATPLPLYLYGALGIVTLAFWLLARTGNQPLLRRAGVVVVVGVYLGSGCWEARFHITPKLTVNRTQTIYVIGDSISAGLINGEETWPDILARKTGIKTVNLARAGARIHDGGQQAQKIPRSDSLVFLEMGGNDLLGSTSAASFGQSLRMLLGTLQERGVKIVMFEFPLYPGANAFGSEQRKAAAEFHITLIPKSLMTAVFTTPGATVDGIHLSPSGHQLWAEKIAALMQIEP